MVADDVHPSYVRQSVPSSHFENDARQTVSTEQQEVDTADFVACRIQMLPRRSPDPGEIFWFRQTLPWGDISVSTFKYKLSLYANINTASWLTWRQTSAVVNRADRRLAACVVNCCKRSATLGICCSQSSSVVLTTPKSNEQEAGERVVFKTATLVHQSLSGYTPRVTWPTTVSSSPTPVSDNCVLPSLEHSLSVSHAAVLETGPLLQQDHNLDSLQPNLRLSRLSYAQFRQLLKIFLLEQLCHGAV